MRRRMYHEHHNNHDRDDAGRTHVVVRLYPAAQGRFERLFPDVAAG